MAWCSWPGAGGRRIVDVLGADREAVAAARGDVVKPVASGKTPYIRFDGNDHSVPHVLVKNPLTLVASETALRILDGDVDTSAATTRARTALFTTASQRGSGFCRITIHRDAGSAVKSAIIENANAMLVTMPNCRIGGRFEKASARKPLALISVA